MASTCLKTERPSTFDIRAVADAASTVSASDLTDARAGGASAVTAPTAPTDAMAFLLDTRSARTWFNNVRSTQSFMLRGLDFLRII